VVLAVVVAAAAVVFAAVVWVPACLAKYRILLNDFNSSEEYNFPTVINNCSATCNTAQRFSAVFTSVCHWTPL
jgi:hypothetical protein